MQLEHSHYRQTSVIRAGERLTHEEEAEELLALTRKVMFSSARQTSCLIVDLSEIKEDGISWRPGVTTLLEIRAIFPSRADEPFSFVLLTSPRVSTFLKRGCQHDEPLFEECEYLGGALERTLYKVD